MHFYLFAEGFAQALRTILLVYLILTFMFTVYSIARMYWCAHVGSDVKGGKERMRQLRKVWYIFQRTILETSDLL